MSRYIAISALILSVVTFVGQLFLFTHTDEQVIWGMIGVFVYGVGVGKSKLFHSSNVIAVGSAVTAGIILGLLPPRLRLGGAVDCFVLFFPLVHSVLLTIYLILGADELG
ncbi:hypothetical protein BJI69_19820 [Luteibacter rhizovicinus DSM 16549]|uniref:Uncharacterized protein n=1 Tax=Luteibacter rhizovicinus DSM 16549 TaxID=1440763 RepID=A0A0G9HBY6_9GAMM|nr:hypothetical protein [Luteibacter rhizovicinus]APG05928.1 hypothetical protein BJI69_19820 [Luteibacter rhizovicinus DSM 16549]KLD67123.1 hypothetical protein Y883_09175 [Luteibacter rhizovicinus DSM 16549]